MVLIKLVTLYLPQHDSDSHRSMPKSKNASAILSDTHLIPSHLIPNRFPQLKKASQCLHKHFEGFFTDLSAKLYFIIHVMQAPNL